MHGGTRCLDDLTEDGTIVLSVTSTPDVSIIIPCYNGQAFLARCLQSAAALAKERGGPTYEAILVDDGSTEDIRQIASQYSPWVRYVWQQNQGASAARNKGIRESSGRYVRFLDADDYLISSAGLAEQVRVLETHPDVGLVYAQSLKVDSNDRPFGLRRPPFARAGYVRAGEEELGSLLFGNYITTSSALVRRSVLDRAGLFPVGQMGGEDWDLWLRIARASSIAYVAEPVVAYRHHEYSVRSGYTVDSWLAMHTEVLDKQFADPAFAQQFAPIREALYGRLHRRVASLAFRKGQRELTRHHARIALRSTVKARRWPDSAQCIRLMLKSYIPPASHARLQLVSRQIRRTIIASSMWTEGMRGPLRKAIRQEPPSDRLH